MSKPPIRMYFSFRSPYAWLSLERVRKLPEDIRELFSLHAVSPPEDIDKRLNYNSSKLSYLFEDIRRVAEAYGFQVVMPDSFDTDWERPHAAFIHAQKCGSGLDFGCQLYQQRFLHGKDIATDDVLTDVALEVGLDADELLQQADSRQNRKQLLVEMARASRDGTFGVPFFVYQHSHYWGNDRLEWLLRDIQSQQGKEIPDLSGGGVTLPCIDYDL